MESVIEKDFNFYYRQDLLKLFSKFYELNSFRYTEFVDVWNSLKFYQIFSLQKLFPFDYRYIMKDIFKIAMEYLYDEELFYEVRTCALYTLYALYNNLASIAKMKIPVSPSQWINILKFVNMINQAEHVDVEYVFRHLLHSDAFEFCSTHEMTTKSSYLKGVANLKLNKINATSEVDTLSVSAFKDFILNDELNEQMKTIHDAYLQCKEELAQCSGINSVSTYINIEFDDLIKQEMFDKLKIQKDVSNDKMSSKSSGSSSKSTKTKKHKKSTLDSKNINETSDMSDGLVDENEDNS